MNEQYAKALIEMNPYKRDLYFLECTLSKIVLAYISKKDYQDLLKNCKSHLNNILYCYGFERLESHFKTVRCNYSKTLFDKCSIDLYYFENLLKKNGGRI